MAPPNDQPSTSSAEADAYKIIERRRASFLGQVLNIQKKLETFNLASESIHVLKNSRDMLTNLNRQHQTAIAELQRHSQANYDDIENTIEVFRAVYTDTLSSLDEKLELLTVDNAQTCKDEMMRILLSFHEFKLFVDESTPDNLSMGELRARFRDFQPLLDQFVDCWSKLYRMSDEKVQATMKDERRNFTSEFYSISGWFETHMNPRPTTSVLSAAATKSESVVKLPKIELPSFDGQVTNWVYYRDSFKSLVHSVTSISNAVKFRYLKSSITDKFSPIKHLLETDEGYEAAWTATLEYYDDPRRIADSHFAEMMKIKRMDSESHDELQRVLNDFTLHSAALGRMIPERDQYNAFLSHMVLYRLDNHTRDLWETEHKGSIPLWPELQNFLKKRRKTLSTMNVHPKVSKGNQQSSTRASNANAATISRPKNPENKSTASVDDKKGKKPLKCHMCSGDHRLHTCSQFLNLPVPGRLARIADFKICANCFGPHPINNCTSPFTCRTCKQKHHTLIHVEAPRSTHALQSDLQPDAATFYFPSSSCHTVNVNHAVTLLPTAMVKLQDTYGNWYEARAFLDSGSDSNYISTSVAKALRLSLEPTYIEANGLGGKCAAVIRHKMTTLVGSESENFVMEFLVTPKVTNMTPNQNVAAANLQIPGDMKLADPTFYRPGKIDLLIGNEHFGDLLRDGKIKLAAGPTMFNTAFGWVFSGKVPTSTASESTPSSTRSVFTLSTQRSVSTLAELKQCLEKFYKLEDYRIGNRFLSDEEAHCEKVFTQTHSRTATGRLKVFIPLKETISMIKNNYRVAAALFLILEKRLQKSPNLQTAYSAFMREYEELGHMTEIDISEEDPNAEAYYFPHHAVENPDSSTTKTRVVFNGSAKTSSGISFNDAQCVGPQIQSDVFTLAIRFRIFPIAVKADIEKMYRQIEIAESQRKYQRIIWRDSPNDKLKVYELNTITYGTASASFLATRCLKELGEISRSKFPKAAVELIDSFYVDDCITGANSIEEANEIAQGLMEILNSAGMNLRKFNSNSAEFLQNIPADRVEASNDDKPIKALGIGWNPQTDMLHLEIQDIKFEKITRRSILSEIHRLYDPEGLIGPVTFRFKLFLKRIFQLQMSWDAPVPETDAAAWTEIASQFPILSQLRIPRHFLLSNYIDIQLHGFSDASDAGYGIAIYIRSTNSSNQTMSQLVCSKSRIAPNETKSTARLELCGAVMLAVMMSQVANSLKLQFSKKICWSDSAIALQWIKKMPSQMQIFVANRISEIQEISREMQLGWRHIKGTNNPADLISRGLTPIEILNCALWWHGPDFLLLPEQEWPKSIVEVDVRDPAFSQEFRKIESLVITSTVAAIQVNNDDTNIFFEWIENSSRSWAVKRKMAHVMRFIHNCRARSLQVPLRDDQNHVDDMRDAEYALARIYQAKHFPQEFQTSMDGLPIPSKSPLKNLNPVWDDKNRLMRVGGRLNLAIHCSEDQRNPIILPNCHFARIIIRETHQQNMHAGQNTTLGFVRLRYWPLRSKHIVRQEVHHCIKCFRTRPTLSQQFMGQLPLERATPSPVFYNTGVDYCGPFDFKLSFVRNAGTGKCYVALFICLATKAIHLEVVTDLTTDAFFAAFDKFTSRRGLPRSMMSDHGLNFVGAGNELQELFEFLNNETTQAEIRFYLSQQEVSWSFIPPHAPAQGGLWEAGVKSMKHHLHRVARQALLTFEEFDRLKSKIEAILNSRPLTALSNDPSDFSALTAGHFLIGRPLIAKADRDLSQPPITRLQRWERVVQMQQHFWQRWSRDYLHQLQVRTKNYKKVIPLSVGQLVLLHIDNAPPMHWPMGRITRIYPGSDGVTRVASIRTETSNYERSLDKLALLPITPDDDQLEPPEYVRDDANNINEEEEEA